MEAWFSWEMPDVYALAKALYGFRFSHKIAVAMTGTRLLCYDGSLMHERFRSSDDTPGLAAAAASMTEKK
jgi:hypothetical protein